MTADEVIALRKLWDHFNYRYYLPEATVLASRDWVNYVQAMTDLIPRDEPFINYPNEEEVRWEWQEGVAIVMDEPITLDHTIVSKQDMPGSRHIDVEPHAEPQTLAGLVFGIGQMMPTRQVAGLDPLKVAAVGNQMPPEVYGIPVMWIGIEPSDIVTSSWLPGSRAIVQGEARYISESTRFVIAVITALGHRLTTLGEPIYSGRGERRRVKRELGSLRVLSLRSGASVRSQEGTGEVAWSKRWLVRGHWHTVAHGPEKKLRRLQWYDPYVKGPEDKPFDDRRTIWRT